jgi:hypothetical protein
MLLALGSGHAADPVRIAVYTSNLQQLPDALREFERVNGKGLIDLVVMDADTPPEMVAGARVIYAYLMNAALYEHFAVAAQQTAAAGAVILAQPPDIAAHRWQVKPDVEASARAYAGWRRSQLCASRRCISAGHAHPQAPFCARTATPGQQHLSPRQAF